MPQMKPLNWFFIYLLCFVILIMTISSIYTLFFKKMKKNNFLKFDKIWMWKW